MLDFTKTPYFDDHTHLLNVNNREINLKEYIGPFNHGYVDDLAEGVVFDNMTAGNNRPNDISDDMLEYNVKQLGVSKVFVKYMSEFFGCECDYDTVLKERNKRSMQDMKAYTKELYEDMNIFAEVLDAPHAMGAEETKCFPVKYTLRLFQTDPVLNRLMKMCESYEELIVKFDAEIVNAIKTEGFCGIKCHVLELNEQHPHYVSAAEAETYFRAAKRGDKKSMEEIYFATFSHMMIMTQKYDFPVHVHAGLTGKDCFNAQANYDPLCFTPYLADNRLRNAHLVLLHCGFPHVRTAAVLAQNFPNVWIDVAQVLPWDVVNFPNILEQCMSFSSHGKIMMGSGAHGHPEINWLAAKVAKQSMKIVLERAVERGFMTQEQAQHTGELLCYKNAMRLYKLEY